VLNDKNMIWPFIHILSKLEESLDEPFSNNYKETVEASIQKLIEENGDLNI